MQQQTDVAQNVLELDLAEKEKETDEINTLVAAQSEMKEQKEQAIADIAAGGLEAALGAQQQQSVLQGAKDISPAALSAVKSAFGVSEEEARGLFELAVKNPEIFALLKTLQ